MAPLLSEGDFQSNSIRVNSADFSGDGAAGHSRRESEGLVRIRASKIPGDKEPVRVPAPPPCAHNACGTREEPIAQRRNIRAIADISSKYNL
jgi:hypothetical protein